MVQINSCVVILVMIVASYKCENKNDLEENLKSTEDSRGSIQNLYKEQIRPSQKLKKDFSGDELNDLKHTYPQTREDFVRTARNNYDYVMQPEDGLKPEKIKPGQFADKSNTKTKMFNVPHPIKTTMSPDDSKISWSFWENDDSQFWADDADDSHAPIKEMTTTTKAPKGDKGSVSVHKHYIYFKEAESWPSPSPPMYMPAKEMLPMLPEEITHEMMKGMMSDDMLMKKPQKKGISGIIQKLSSVDPVTILVAGIIPASLILSAVIPSVMKQMMNANMQTATMMPPMMMMMPMMTTTTAMADTTAMGGREYDSEDPPSMTHIIQTASQFGLQALKDPKCARKKFCRFARKNLLSKTPEFNNILRIATVAMEDSWLDIIGVRDILQSLSLGTCDEEECDDPAEIENGTTQPTTI